MRVLLATLLVSSALAFDAVLFSNDQKITRDFPSAENILSTASAEAPVVFFVNPDFNLGQFSAHANAYSDDKKVSGLPATVKDSKYSAARFIDSGIHTPSAVEVTSADAFATGSAVYIVAGEDWTSLDKLAQELTSKLGDKFTGVITASEAVSKDQTRVKRVATEEMDATDSPSEGGPSTRFDMPLNIPPYNRTTGGATIDIAKNGNCMLYAEGVNIVVYNGKGQYANIPIRSVNGTQWDYSEGDVKCVNGTVGHYFFTVRFVTGDNVLGTQDRDTVVQIPKGTTVSFTLDIYGDIMGYWQLSNITAVSLSVEPSSGSSGWLDKKTTVAPGTMAKQIDYMGLNSVQGWAYGCSDSQAAFFKTDNGDAMIGVSFYNTEIQTYGVVDVKRNMVYFTLNVDDCTGTFSPGSWMAIISSVVLLIGFFFGYLMLNSVKTMDRFDDPKQRQILINVRE